MISLELAAGSAVLPVDANHAVPPAILAAHFIIPDLPAPPPKFAALQGPDLPQPLAKMDADLLTPDPPAPPPPKLVANFIGPDGPPPPAKLGANFITPNQPMPVALFAIAAQTFIVPDGPPPPPHQLVAAFFFPDLPAPPPK
jgi:hypothetical protein